MIRQRGHGALATEFDVGERDGLRNVGVAGRDRLHEKLVFSVFDLGGSVDRHRAEPVGAVLERSERAEIGRASCRERVF